MKLCIVFHSVRLRVAFWAITLMLIGVCLGISLQANPVKAEPIDIAQNESSPIKTPPKFSTADVDSAADKVPDLPLELRDRFELKSPSSAGKMVFIDFYSPYCGVCQMMEPQLKTLQAMAGDKVHFERLDITKPENSRYENTFKLIGTPMYLLYDKDGKPVYRMQEKISSMILIGQVLRLSKQAQTVDDPPVTGYNSPFEHSHAKTAPSSGAHAAPSEMVLLSFGNKACVECRQGERYLNAFGLAGQEDLSVVNLDADNSEVKKYMKSLKVKKLPTYVLLDDSNQVLFKIEGKMETAERAKALWDIIRGFSDMGI